MAAYKLPKATEAEKKSRRKAIEQATHTATEVPLEVAQAATTVLDHLRRLVSIGSPVMASDVKTGEHLAVAALRGALENVKINLDSIQDQDFRERVRNQATQLEAVSAGK
jgi:formiminotetrahydrofolate cyclodeaminase